MINNLNDNLLKLQEIAHLQDSSAIIQQIQLVERISKDSEGLSQLLELLINKYKYTTKNITYTDSIIFKCLYNCQIKTLKDQLHRYLQKGIVKLESECNIDYNPLYISLVSNNFKEANKLTQLHLNNLAKTNIKQPRQWLYFTDIFSLPTKDLQTIDQLWTIYSIGKFGFSIQRKIWLHHNKDWEKFWHIIGWKVNKQNVRYPNEFIWDRSAPTGHLPLFNQIRGVQVLAALFIHPAWSKNNNATN